MTPNGIHTNIDQQNRTVTIRRERQVANDAGGMSHTVTGDITLTFDDWLDLATGGIGSAMYDIAQQRTFADELRSRLA